MSPERKPGNEEDFLANERVDPYRGAPRQINPRINPQPTGPNNWIVKADASHYVSIWRQYNPAAGVERYYAKAQKGQTISYGAAEGFPDLESATQWANRSLGRRAEPASQ